MHDVTIGMLDEFKISQSPTNLQDSKPLPTDTNVTTKPISEDNLVIESRAFYAGMDGRYKTFSDYKLKSTNH